MGGRGAGRQREQGEQGEQGAVVGFLQVQQPDCVGLLVGGPAEERLGPVLGEEGGAEFVGEAELRQRTAGLAFA